MNTKRRSWRGGAFFASAVAICLCSACKTEGTAPAATVTDEKQRPKAEMGDEVSVGSSAELGPEVPGVSHAQLRKTKEVSSPVDEVLGTTPQGVALPVGADMPDVTVQDIEGRDMALADLARDKSLMVVFYRGGWCPYCNAYVHELASNQKEFDARNVLPVMISVDKPEVASKTKAAYEVNFPLLSDSQLAAHDAFGVTMKPTDRYVKKVLNERLEMKLADYAGKDHGKYAIPSVFIIDKQRKIRWAHADPQYNVRPKFWQLLQAIDDLDLGS